ncbi:hypothetical protein KBY22_11735, partial [Ruegeria pomeroyi]|nr:hypothetical protein [Ruegeria pomeroyi]MCE8526700.1 hypothetical protein [Ruegeria pomeroyi]
MKTATGMTGGSDDVNPKRFYSSKVWIDRKSGAEVCDLGFDLVLDGAVGVFAIGGQAIDHLDDPV